MNKSKTKKSFSVRELTMIAFFTSITAILAQISIPLPFTPMPISFGLVAVYITGMMLKPKHAIAAQICYLLLGAVGFPVFGNFRGGIGALFGPTGGYLLVYPIMAGIVAIALNGRKRHYKKQSKQRLYLKAIFALCLAHLTIYLGGTLWLSFTTATSFYASLTLAMIPFIPLDIVKIVFCIVVVLPFRSRLIAMNLILLDDPLPQHKAKVILATATAGSNLSFKDASILMDAGLTPLDELIQAADALTRRYFKKEISMCAIYPAKVGHCSGDCAFCAQSVHHKCSILPINVGDLKESEILAYAKELYWMGVGRFSLVTSGEHLTDEEFDHIINILKKLHQETEIGLCASLGSLDEKRAKRLADAGVNRYHHNIETSRSYFPKICSTHTYDDKLKTINIARQAGMEVCCGGIISMGETSRQRIEMAFALKELNVDCIPINILNPIPGTRLEGQHPLSADEILRTIAIFRLILQNKTLKFAGGRENALQKDEYRGYRAGINSMLVGNYLTTEGKTLKDEMDNLKEAGFTIISW